MNLKNGDGRAPCCGWTGKAAEHFGTLFQHQRHSEESVSVYPNNTKVPNWNYLSPGAPGPDIDPYARESSSILTDAAACAPAVLACGGAGTGKPGCDGADVVNTFGASATKVNFALCMKWGSKRVQAQRSWHGSPQGGFLDPSRTVATTLKPITVDNPFRPASSYNQFFSPGPISPNKYLECVVHASVQFIPNANPGCASGAYNFTRDVNIDVNPLTGLKMASAFTTWNPCAAHSTGGNVAPDPRIFIPLAAKGVDYWLANNDVDPINGTKNGIWSLLGQDFSNSSVFSVVATDNSFTYTVIASGLPACEAVWDLSRVTMSIKIYGQISGNCDDGGGGPPQHWGVTTESEIAMNETSFSYVFTETGDGGVQNVTIVTATYNNANPAAAVVQDDYNLLALWPLNDDKLYPWRHDAFTKRAPLVTRNEPADVGIGPGDPADMVDPHNTLPIQDAGCLDPSDPDWTPTYAPIPWVDPNTGRFDGSIIGAPHRVNDGVPDKYWDGRHANYELCTLGETDYFYIASYGRWNVDDAMPATATQWTTLNEENTDGNPNGTLPDHWIREVPGGGIRMQKEAIIFQPTPSQNYFGPSGPYRFQFANVRCITGVSSGVVALFAPLTDPVNAGDLFRVNGSELVTPGIYQVTKVDDSHYHLDTLLYDLTGYVDALDISTSLLSGTVTSQFGKLRWPKAWPIQGRAMIASATQSGGNVNLVIEAAPYLRTGDVIDVTGVSGLGANLTVTVTDSTHVIVPGTLLGFTPGAFITSHGAPEWSWFDNRVKGDYVLLNWTHDYRDSTVDASIRANQVLWGMPQDVKVFSADDHCLCWKPCCPMVVCASPNGETWTNGITHAFPAAGAVALDDAKGYLRQGTFQLAMGELFWQADPKPCVDNADIDQPPTCIQWDPDDGSCLGNFPGTGCGTTPVGQFYYPLRPYVEARNTLPHGAPALPAGIFTGFLDQATMLAGPPPAGVHGAIALPPNAGGASGGAWVTWNAQFTCVQTNQQFAGIYGTEIIF